MLTAQCGRDQSRAAIGSRAIGSRALAAAGSAPFSSGNPNSGFLSSCQLRREAAPWGNGGQVLQGSGEWFALVGGKFRRRERRARDMAGVAKGALGTLSVANAPFAAPPTLRMRLSRHPKPPLGAANEFAETLAMCGGRNPPISTRQSTTPQ